MKNSGEIICPGMTLLRALADPGALKPVIDQIFTAAPARHMKTQRGFTMSAAMSNCGDWGWVSDQRGYRYQSEDPVSGLRWPKMPAEFSTLASAAALLAGFPEFNPNACLINNYKPGSQMGAHQDADEADFSQPIVSVSLGLPVRFFVGGTRRGGATIPVDLRSADVIVFGAEARLRYHGVRILKPGVDPVFGERRINLTLRRAK